MVASPTRSMPRVLPFPFLVAPLHLLRCLSNRRLYPDHRLRGLTRRKLPVSFDVVEHVHFLVPPRESDNAAPDSPEWHHASPYSPCSTTPQSRTNPPHASCVPAQAERRFLSIEALN